MPYYLTADGGGTKLQVVLFDDAFRAVGRGVSGGTNTNFIPLADVHAHMDEALDAALAPLPPGEPVDTCWATIVGPGRDFEALVRARCPLGRFVHQSEGVSYLLAGALSASGVVALAGTGSGAVCVEGGAVRRHLGGHGSTIGDDGSGWWIGSRGVGAVIREYEQWGPATALTPLLLDYLGISDLARLHDGIYYSGRDARSVAAGFCPYVGRAADGGDPAALAILREAASLMAMQVGALYPMLSLPDDTPVCLCGGAWRSTPLFPRFFAERLAERVPAPVRMARFQPILHGAVALALARGIDPESVADRFADFF